MLSAYISFKPLHSSYKWASVNVPLLLLDWNPETAHQFQFQSFPCRQLMVLDFDKDLTVTHHLRILTATATMTALSYFNKDTPSALLADDKRSQSGSIFFVANHIFSSRILL